ncbi:YkgJ family cysteine cluster protein [Desulfatitalea tepidiphila]|uniref:YkgJ family cysteine cluster protein n=1 Tax=Desulfatitalea tepidiphila TaxID=1185843 RepID=UPI0006B55E6E|nr:YkgJ family cysteine cluster protein [Desulfatitalea tepidiphila]
MSTVMHPSEYQCRRCGTCCCKGGPALHVQDETLVTSGKILLKDLCTIREGEPAFDNIRGVVSPAPSDIIKIKGVSDTDATCRFLNQETVGCTIYDHRPAECRVLTCWDTQAIMMMYDQDRLTRSRLLSRLPGLFDLVGEHQHRCAYPRVAELATAIKNRKMGGTAAKELLGMVRYDQSLRQVTVERSRLDPSLLDFLFGRPLAETLRRFQVKIIRNGPRITIVPAF